MSRETAVVERDQGVNLSISVRFRALGFRDLAIRLRRSAELKDDWAAARSAAHLAEVNGGRSRQIDLS